MPAMAKALMPMMGGIICPPLDAAASIPPASSGLKPNRFMRGMVMVPTTAALAAALPVIMPMPQLATTAIMAAPPRILLITILPSVRKNLSAPVPDNTPPKRMKRKRKFADIGMKA